MKKLILSIIGLSLCLTFAAGGHAADRPGFLFSPYKYTGVNTDRTHHTISTRVTGTLQNVLDALPHGLDALTLAFASGECGSEKWDDLTGAELASANLQRFDKAGVFYVISTGGADQVFTCATPGAFLDFIKTYYTPHMVGVDFDIEAGQSQSAIDDLVRDVKIAQKHYPNLRFSFTLPTFGSNKRASPALGTIGIKVLKSIRRHHLRHYLINLMTMDYAHTNATRCTLGANGLCDMGASAKAAVENLHARFNIPYDRIEVTPMIGGNDARDEVFTIEDAAELARYARQVGLAGIHFWSFDRDTDCAPSEANNTCNSYGKAGTLGFTKRFIADGP